MSHKFVRNITDTVLNGEGKEPLNTNIQNDLLSDGEDVAVRNKDEYHKLTDNIKTVTSRDELLTVEETVKNSINLQVKEVELTNGNEQTLEIEKLGLNEYQLTVPIQEDIDFPAVQLESTDENTLSIEEVSTNNFRLTVPEQTKTETDVSIESGTPDLLTVEETSPNQFTLSVNSTGGTGDVTLNSTTPTILTITETSEGVYDLGVNLPPEKPDMNLTTGTPETVTITENGTNDFNVDVVSGGGSSDPVTITTSNESTLTVDEPTDNSFILTVPDQSKPDMSLTTATPETVTITENGTNDFNVDVVSGGGSSDPVTITSGTPDTLTVVENSTNDFTLNVDMPDNPINKRILNYFCTTSVRASNFTSIIPVNGDINIEYENYKRIVRYYNSNELNSIDITMDFMDRQTKYTNVIIRKSFDGNTHTIPPKGSLDVEITGSLYGLPDNSNSTRLITIDKKEYTFEVVI